MDFRIIFHRLVQQDMDDILRYYREKASDSVSDRFFQAFLETVDRASSNPRGFHFTTSMYRRANIPEFPYHFLYRESLGGIRVLVLRHDRRHPEYGMRRA